jgi:hypothetical protein
MELRWFGLFHIKKNKILLIIYKNSSLSAKENAAGQTSLIFHILPFNSVISGIWQLKM